MLLLYFGLLFTLAISSACPHRIRLKDVSTLTFHHGKSTRSRHGNRIPALECVGGSAFKHTQYHPSSVQCYNRGFDGRNVNWECKAQLDKSVRFGALTVNCEGYDYPDDEYVTYGSCGLQYELVFTGHKPSHGYDNRRSFTTIWLPRFSPCMLIGGSILVAAVIWHFCLRNSLEYSETAGYEGIPSAVPPSAPYPTESPPDYEEATRTRPPNQMDHSTRFRAAPPSYGWRPNLFPSSSSGWFSSRRGHRRKTEPVSSSWWSHGLAAGAGLLGGYVFGSRDRDIREALITPTTTTTTHSRRNRLYPDLDETDSFVSYGDDSSDYARGEVYTATGYATTARR